MSGHAVNCQRIKMRDAEEIYNEIEYKLHKVNPDWPISAIGSLFKKDLDAETGDIDIAYADPQKAEKELNWKAQYTIKDMCKDAYRFAIKNYHRNSGFRTIVRY